MGLKHQSTMQKIMQAKALAANQVKNAISQAKEKAKDAEMKLVIKNEEVMKRTREQMLLNTKKQLATIANEKKQDTAATENLAKNNETNAIAAARGIRQAAEAQG